MADRHDDRSSEPLAATLERLRRERDDADRRYNDALTELDRAVMRMPELPPPPPAYDDHQLSALNDGWQTAGSPPAGGLKAGIASIVWRIVGPSLQKQAAFNSRLVDHLNRNTAAHREAQRAAASTIDVLRDQLPNLIAFQSRLIVYLQQVTAYVDTRDRESGGRALIVNAAVNGVADDLAKRWESMVAREQRFDAKVASLASTHEELRTLIGISQQATLAMKREIERMSATGHTVETVAAPAATAFAPALDAYKYVGFEDQFRGSQETIRARLESYVPIFADASDVLDVGCGRGEFLDLLNAHGISARGIDLNHEMVEVCRARGLNVTEADAVTYLDGVPDGSLGGLFAAQVVEHLQPGYLLRFLELAHHKLRANAPIVLETLNPACWVAFFESFIRDITHVWPLHPDTLRYLVLASGFGTATIEFRSPVPEEDRLQPAPSSSGLPSAVVEAFNANVEKLNARMFTSLDYAIVGRR